MATQIASKSETAAESVDVLIVGAGISGIGMAVHLRDKCPGKSFARYGIEQQAEIVSHYFLLKTGARLRNGYGIADYEGLLPF